MYQVMVTSTTKGHVDVTVLKFDSEMLADKAVKTINNQATLFTSEHMTRRHAERLN